MLEDGLKAITVAQLQAVMGKLPSGAWLWPNSVGNLTVFDDHPARGGRMVGWIDFLFDGEYEEVSDDAAQKGV